MDVAQLENFYEELQTAISGGVKLVEWLDDSPERRRIFHSKPWQTYYKSRRNVHAGNAPDNAKGEASPHALLAIPRSLVNSALWRKLGPGPRDLYMYLLMRSNTRSFKDVWPGAETIENDLDIDRRTRWKYEAALTGAKSLKIYQPGERDHTGQTHRSRRFAFTITRYLNADRRAYNESKGREVYGHLRDMHSLWTEVERVAARVGYDAQNLKDREGAARIILDQMAKRMKITSIDEKGRVHASVFSTLYPASIAESQLPNNVLIFPETANQDVIINPKETWASMEKKLYRAMGDAAAKQSMSGLIDFLQSIEDSKQKSGDSRTA